MKSDLTRRQVLAAAPLAASARLDGRPALLGGTPVRQQPFPSWPVFDQREEKALLETLRSGRWYRGSGDHVKQFEEAYARATGARHCLATCNGTSALFVCLNALDVQPGDEVIVPPYTFIATVNVVLRQFALPVFVDTDPETFQMDASKLEAAVSDRTRAIIPVHLGGNVCDLDRILDIARRRNIPVIEDACQAHMAEWKGRKAGTFGAAGCFSFQASKNLNSGEGGAVLTGDGALYERAYAFHNNGSGLKAIGTNFTYSTTGHNLRLTEFQAALLLAQLTRLDGQVRTRSANGAYLTSLLEKIPGIRPAKQYAGCTLNAYHLYMFRYDAREFDGLPRETFLRALRAEGIPAAAGYSPLNTQPFLKNTLNSRGYQRLFPEKILREWPERTACPANDRLCQEAVWLTQNMLLGPRSDMDSIAEAIERIRRHAGELRRLA
ncbi:MAG: DegT/DnrJ/EryC1/StrS family aminotransferase [Bryobacteraceae bacterium]|nr:DegT/DnrJ/EryC1/StrS family aminotransferase [Bryobacteraceae bacterium]